ncbi:hypothetical protein ABB37_00697 [Leptomonas pyrrhocoris]|uniref:PHD-type domain-containing protein n=1 Tax=Leptomonas pyrrhocoris TaxID=157538 RepID=A0A0N0VI06_LEPPY|nr:hypothetical protein ABB37_00697 [Leptomonas pyrrhocoris]KPA86561.1 hypothetical protein ABB37_00697 [Leptomonas pyrrhocoris]|eukprot:XP_015665000.1 hypothetical protein ABB37_00697 [Leptomonas pyrrhocoris]
MDPNLLSAASDGLREEHQEESLLLGDDARRADGNAKAPTALSEPFHASQQEDRCTCTFSTQQPRLSLAPVLAAVSAAVDTQLDSSLSHDSITAEDEEEDHTLDSEAEHEPMVTQESIQVSPAVTQRSKPDKGDKAHLPLLDTACRAFSPAIHDAEQSATFSQLVSAVDDILGCSQQHAMHNVRGGSSSLDSSLQSRPPTTNGNGEATETETSALTKSSQLCGDAEDSSSEEHRLRSRQAVRDDAHDGSNVLTNLSHVHDSPAAFTVLLAHQQDWPHNLHENRGAECVFCGNSVEAQRHRRRAPPLVSSDGYSYHLTCALWCPEVYVEEASQSLRGVAAAVQRARHIKCALCRQPGAAVGCAISICPLSYHLPCAVKAGALMNTEQFVLRCPAHKGEGNAIGPRKEREGEHAKRSQQTKRTRLQ